MVYPSYGKDEVRMDNNNANETLIINHDKVLEFVKFLEHCSRVASEDAVFVTECNNKQQDLLHDLEIPDKMYAKDITYLGRELRNLRKTRRKLKDELMLATNIVNFLKKHPQLIEELNGLAKVMMESEEYLKNRSYTVKSTLFTTTELESKKLEDDAATVLSIVTKILKKWSTNYEILQEDCKDPIHSNKHHTVNYTLTNMNFNLSAVKSTFNNFHRAALRDIGAVLSIAEDKLTISDMPLTDYSAKTSKLMATHIYKMTDGTVYEIHGSITYKFQRPVSKSKKGKGKRR